MKLKRNDLMKCNQCGQTIKVKDLKRFNERKFEDGIEADLICPFCDSPMLSKVEAKPKKVDVVEEMDKLERREEVNHEGTT